MERWVGMNGMKGGKEYVFGNSECIDVAMICNYVRRGLWKRIKGQYYVTM